MELNISLAAEPILHLGPLVITNSMLTSLIVTFVILLLFLLSIKKVSLVPGGIQNFVEFIVESLLNFSATIVGEKKAKEFFPLFATIFLYVLFSNWLGLLPGVGTIGIWEELHGKNLLIPLFRSPSADLNNTLAIALVAVIAIQYYGVKHLGMAYFKKFFDLSNAINFFVGLLEIVSDFSKSISFSFRLFGNIFAGEVLLLVISALLPFAGPLPFLGLEIFVGFIQALVFSMLTLVFIQVATSHH